MRKNNNANLILPLPFLARLTGLKAAEIEAKKEVIEVVAPSLLGVKNWRFLVSSVGHDLRFGKPTPEVFLLLFGNVLGHLSELIRAIVNPPHDLAVYVPIALVADWSGASEKAIRLSINVDFEHLIWADITGPMGHIWDLSTVAIGVYILDPKGEQSYNVSSEAKTIISVIRGNHPAHKPVLPKSIELLIERTVKICCLGIDTSDL